MMIRRVGVGLLGISALCVAGSAHAAYRADTGSDVRTERYLPRAEAPAMAAVRLAEGPAIAAVRLADGDRFVGHAADTLALDSANAIVQGVCARCHNDRLLRGNRSFETFEVEGAVASAELAEKMIRKLRAGMMPPPGPRRPDDATLAALAATLEARIDTDAQGAPRPGVRTFQRLNRAEYELAVRDLLGLSVDAAAYLPPDTKSANFDNIADVQLLSPTLTDGYLRAAAEVSRLAIGDPQASPREATYRVSRWASQMDRVEGAPFGTRGGIAVEHVFPADGLYHVRMSFHHETTGTLYGNGRSSLNTPETPEQIEISIDGERKALIEMERWMHVSDPDGVNIRSEPIAITAGPHMVSAAFLKRFEGPVQDLISPHDWTIASTSIAGSYGFTALPHMRDMAITGPFDAAGVSETPTRERIFTCRPADLEDQRSCAADILGRLATQAYRRPVTDGDMGGLMALYDAMATTDGFEVGVRTGLEGILASPSFLFRLEEPEGEVGPDGVYRISDVDLASRLSFFLWGSVPDDELRTVAARGELSEGGNLEVQVRRMLADPRAEALATRFAAQWLRLPDLDGVHPDVRKYPDFHQQLADAMRRETELFFDHLVREDRSVLELLTADYTFVNERLAKHYGIPDVAGEAFRRVRYPDDTRRGLLAHASILTQTSHAERTSPVLRGKWVMEVLLGTPPPPPPPDVPDLEVTEDVGEGRFLTVRERLEIHRGNPACRSCHTFIDPIGLALENFDATGRWRIKDEGSPVDPTGELYDGTSLQGPADLRGALLRRDESFLRTFTENLMAYALGRRVEYYDMPTIRAVVREARAQEHRMSAYILGVVRSPAFLMNRVEVADGAQDGRSNPRR